MSQSPILAVSPLSLPWATSDPFLFCAYHLDQYPGGNAELGPNTSLAGRNIGQDFAGKDGWNMYHGTKVPGFPAHPHAGFETVTVVTQGMVDHSDSLGATGRFGDGDVQWLTSGRGVQHAEVFPLLKEDANPFELFQIWLNLPKRSKKAEPHYKMLWAEDIPQIQEVNAEGKDFTLNLIAGSYKGKKALTPTPDSWASEAASEVQIWTLTIDPHATFELPAGAEGVNRSLYFYEGESITVADQSVPVGNRIQLDPTAGLTIQNGAEPASFLFLQGRPIGEPVAQYGPFVMNSQQEIQQIFQEFQRTQFGGWPWEDHAPTNPKEMGRFARHPDGTLEEK